MAKYKTTLHRIECVETGQIFDSMTEAAASIGRAVSALSGAISRGGKCAGYHWRKVIDPEFSIYKLSFPNGKVYIGQTKQPKLSYRCGRGTGYSQNKAMTADILAFGWDNIEQEILERVDTREEALERERYYILQYRANEPEYGYNTQTNIFSCGTDEELIRHRRDYQREHNNIQNPWKTVICVETGIEYASASEAARQLNLNASHIAEICRGTGQRYTCGGYHWMWGEVI